jgi:hypothetical protein
VALFVFGATPRTITPRAAPRRNVLLRNACFLQPPENAMHYTYAQLASVGPYSQSRPHNTEKKLKEQPDDYEKRTWREKAHVFPESKTGQLMIPPMAFKNCLAEAAAHRSEKIKGKGQKTWTKHFLRGIQVLEPLLLSVTKDEVKPQSVYCNADGKKGSGTRVWRYFPVIEEWGGIVEYCIYDSAITEDEFIKTLQDSGTLVGIGRFRAANGGNYGRYNVLKVDWGEKERREDFKERSSKGKKAR